MTHKLFEKNISIFKISSILLWIHIISEYKFKVYKIAAYVWNTYKLRTLPFSFEVLGNCSFHLWKWARLWWQNKRVRFCFSPNPKVWITKFSVHKSMVDCHKLKFEFHDVNQKLSTHWSLIKNKSFDCISFMKFKNRFSMKQSIIAAFSNVSLSCIRDQAEYFYK